MRLSICRNLAVGASSRKFPSNFKLSLEFLSCPTRQYSADVVTQPLPEGTPGAGDQSDVNPSPVSTSTESPATKKSLKWHSVTYGGIPPASTPKVAVTPNPGTKSREAVQTSSYLSDPENSGRRTGGVNFDTLGSWNNRLKLNIDMDQSIKRGTIVPMISLSSVGKNSLIGRRPANEDRIMAVELKPNILLFGILDGHGGSAAVDHVHEQLPKHVMHWLDRGETKLEEVLRKSYIEVNASFTKLHQQNSLGKEQSISSGTTATVCLIRDGVELTIAHVGDSRAILCRNSTAVRLTVDHLPSEQSEASRIIKCKGHLTWSSLGRSRVNGRLEMTRSIGDVELKTYGVIADPDITTVKIRNGSDSFLALTTDGIHNRLNSSEIVQLIASCTTPQEAAEFLTDQALLFGSEDNCSIVVIPFGAWGKFSEAARQVHFSRNRNPGMRWCS